jgi:hypothetical protein
MGHETDRRRTRAVLTALLTALSLLILAPGAQAGPFHPRTSSLDLTGLNHACGTAVDSKGDLYASSAGESKVKVYNPSHTLLTEISDANTPCGLAVTTTGNLYVTEKATGEVVRFKPNAYPFSGTPTYGSREVVDSSTKAKGIAVDRFDSRLYVAEGDHVAIYSSSGTFEANAGEGTLTEATGVAAYSYTNGVTTQRYLWVADANGVAADGLYLFRGTEPAALALRRELTGSTTPDGSFGFGAAGAFLAADPGDRSAGGECKAVGEEACTSGHLFLYDAAHKALDEFDASGEYFDRTANASFADAEPTAIAIDRSGSANDGTVYVTAGAGSGAKALAFGPLKAPKREVLKLHSEGGLSQELKGAQAVATDSHGDLYAAAEGDSFIHVYGNDGKELTKFADTHNPLDLAVDSTGKVYVLDVNKGLHNPTEHTGEDEVTYYTPSKYPPDASTTYTRRAEPIAVSEDFPELILRAIAVDPGPGPGVPEEPGPGKDRLFIAANEATFEYDSAANESMLLDEEFGENVPTTGQHLSIAVDGLRDIVYFGINPRQIVAIDEETKELLGRFESTGPSKVGDNPVFGVDQAGGHVVEFDSTSTAREYDAAGGFVAGFGKFTEGVTTARYRVAVDNACATHVNGEGNPEPLTETTTPTCKTYDPANGTAYVAFGDTSPTHPPYNGVNAFGVLTYSAPVEHKLTIKKTGSGSGKVTSSPAGIECGGTCSAEFDETGVVTLTATPDPEMEFKGWEGCEAEPSATKCEVTMSKDREVKAKFDSTKPPEEELKVIIEGPGSGEVTSEQKPGIECPPTCSAKFGKGVKVKLIAEAADGSEFVGWEGCEAEPSFTECEVKMSEPKEVKVEFDVAHPLLTVAKEGGGTGTVSSEPPGIDCGSTCSEKFNLDDEVTLEAVADPGSVFSGWDAGDCEDETVSAVEGTCTVTMNEPKKVTATFDALPQVVAKPAQPILYDEATLRGEVNPSGLPTEYRFEYLTEEEYEDNGETFEGAQQTPVAKLAAGKKTVAVEAPLLGLEEGTGYRFLLRAMNVVGSAEDEGSPFETLERRISAPCTTNAEYRTGLSANLPDCRAYELVTPAQTDGLVPNAPGSATSPSRGVSNWLTVQRGGGAGERLSYFTDGTLPGFEGNGVLDGYRAERRAGDHPIGGWGSDLFSPDYLEAAASFLHSPVQLGVAADQLYSAWEIRPEPEGFTQTRPEGVYLRTPTGFEPLGKGSLVKEDLGAIARYVSAGGTHAIFTSKLRLEATAPPAPIQAVYDRAAGASTATVVSTPPSSASPTVKAEFESHDAVFAGVNEDGTAVAFTVGGALYLHREGVTVEVAEAPNTFAGISKDGTRVLYAATANGTSPAALFVCDVGTGACAGSGAHSPTKIANAGIFALASTDGGHVFFSSTEALTGGEENENEEEAQSSAHNLYAWDDTGVRFVGMLSTLDFNKNAFGPPSELNLAAWTKAVATGTDTGRALAPTRSTPLGDVFIFQSHARLTAYYNEGVGEIYRYDPAAEVGERLLCVSCDPTGTPPSTDALLEDVRGDAGDPIQATTMISNLTDDGHKVFFQSFDRLLPEDANEVEDVYEWEAKGIEGCTRIEGCLALISSGQGEVPSFLYAMSADGRDVFIQTKEKLVGADAAGSPSIYDAREGGGIPEPAESAPCQGDACQGQGSEPPAIPSPATTGAGESPEAPPVRKPCAKGRHRVKGRCVKRHAKKHPRRAKRNRRAHR